MSPLILLNAEAAKPIMLPTDVTVITETIIRGEKQLQFSTLKNHTVLHEKEEHAGFSADAAVKALAKAGTKLFTLPYLWGDYTNVGRFFVNPATITHLCVSTPEQRPEQSEPHVGVILSTRGGGHAHTYGVPVRTFEKFLKAVVAANPAMKRIEGTQASSRWYQTGFVLYDPAEVVRVAENGYSGVDLVYRNGGRTDFNLPDKYQDLKKEHMHDLFYRVVRMRGNTKAAYNEVAADRELLARMDDHSGKASHKKGRSLQHAFAQAIAAGVPDLVTIVGTENILHTNLANVSRIGAYDRRVCISYNDNTPEGRGMRDSETVVFPDNAAARKALKDLQRKLG